MTVPLSRFPRSMKAVNITLVFKKDDRTDKANYRLIIILPKLSKVLERCLYNQLYPFFEKVLAISNADSKKNQQCGFRKFFSAQHCITSLIEKWKQCLDQGLVFDVLVTDLSKAFNCLLHELLYAKLLELLVD